MSQDKQDFVRLLQGILSGGIHDPADAAFRASQLLERVKERFPDVAPQGEPKEKILSPDEIDALRAAAGDHDDDCYSDRSFSRDDELQMSDDEVERILQEGLGPASVCLWTWWGSHECYQTACGMLGWDAPAQAEAPPCGACGRLVEILDEQVYEGETIAPGPTVPAPVEAAADGVERVTLGNYTYERLKDGTWWDRGAVLSQGGHWSCALNEILAQRKRAEAAESAYKIAEGSRIELEAQHLENCRLIEAMTASARAALDKISTLEAENERLRTSGDWAANEADRANAEVQRLEAALPHWRAGMRMVERLSNPVSDMEWEDDTDRADLVLNAARSAGLTWEKDGRG